MIRRHWPSRSDRACLCLRQGVHTVNLLGYKNTTAVRSKMKDARLLEVRNLLAQNCLLKPDVEPVERVAVLRNIEMAVVSAVLVLGCPSPLRTRSVCMPHHVT
jgi:hypothetical protein